MGSSVYSVMRMSKKRLIVILRNEHYVNIGITNTEIKDDVLYAYLSGETVGLFDLGYINAYWISEKGEQP